MVRGATKDQCHNRCISVEEVWIPLKHLNDTFQTSTADFCLITSDCAKQYPDNGVESFAEAKIEKIDSVCKACVLG